MSPSSLASNLLMLCHYCIRNGDVICCVASTELILVTYLCLFLQDYKPTHSYGMYLFGRTKLKILTHWKGERVDREAAQKFTWSSLSHISIGSLLISTSDRECSVEHIVSGSCFSRDCSCSCDHSSIGWAHCEPQQCE